MLQLDHEIGASAPALDVDFTLLDIFQRYVSENGPTEEQRLTAVHLQDGGNSQILLSRVEEAMKELLKIHFKHVDPHYEIGDSES